MPKPRSTEAAKDAPRENVFLFAPNLIGKLMESIPAIGSRLLQRYLT